MLVDALRSFRRSLGLPPRATVRRRRWTNHPLAACERLEDRTLLTVLSFSNKHEAIDWTSAGAGGIARYTDADENGTPEMDGDATLSITEDVSGEIIAGYLIWQGIDQIHQGGDGVYDNVTVTFEGVQVTGVSTGSNNTTAGWGEGGGQGFRADVTSLITTGAHDYVVSGLSGKIGHVANGLSLVIVYQDGDRKNDRDLYMMYGHHTASGRTQDGYWNISLADFNYRGGDVRAQLHVGDGQAFNDPYIVFGSEYSGRYTSWHSTADDKLDGDSVRDEGFSRADNGALWDIDTYDITEAFLGPEMQLGPQTLRMSEDNGPDTLTLVALFFDQAAGVREGNIPPSVNDLSVTIDEDTTASGQLVFNDADGDPLTLYYVEDDTIFGDEFSLNATGAFTYTPGIDNTGAATFYIRAYDGIRLSDPALLTINVNPTQDAPVAYDKSVTAESGEQTFISLNYRDPDHETLTKEIVAGPTHGTLTVGSYNRVYYTPEAGYLGEDSFTFRVFDGTDWSNIATVTITVTRQNDPPVILADSTNYATPAGTPVSGQIQATDDEGDPITFSTPADPTNGTLVFNSDGSFTYTPNADFSGTYYFYVQAYDGLEYSGRTRVTIEVAPPNTPPVAEDLFAVVARNSPRDLSLTYDDVDQDPLTVEILSGPSHGTLEYIAGTVYRYTPETDYLGEDAFTYRVFDGEAYSNIATVTLTVQVRPVLDPHSLYYIIDEETSLTGRIVATDANNDPLTFEVVTTPAIGTLTLNADGMFEYQPAPNFAGDVEFQVRAFDGYYYSLTGTVLITVTNVIDAPVAHDFTAQAREDAWEFINFTPFVENGLDRNNWIVEIVDPPDDGIVEQEDDPWRFVYKPNENDNGLDSFTYRVWNGDAWSNTATVTLNVAAVNDPPKHERIVVRTLEDQVYTGQLTGYDVEGDPLTFSRGLTPPDFGVLTVDPSGAFTYTPFENANGWDRFTFNVSDGNATQYGLVEIEVVPQNDAPVAYSTTWNVQEDQLVTLHFRGRVIDAGEQITYEIVDQPANGTIALDPNTETGEYVFTPSVNFSGTTTFTYRMFDGTTYSNIATVTLNVAPVNDPPTASGNDGAVFENSPVGTLAGYVDVLDIDDTTFQFNIVEGNADGFFAIDDNGQVTIAKTGLSHQAQSSYTLRIEVTDPLGATATATVSITVKPFAVVFDAVADSASNVHTLGRGNNTLSTAIFGSAFLNVREINLLSLSLTINGVTYSPEVHKNGSLRYEYQDLNGDGIEDLVIRFDLEGVQPTGGPVAVTLAGQLQNGITFGATDELTLESKHGGGGKGNGKRGKK